MKKEKKLYYFKTFAHSVIVITATNYAQAEEKATQKNRIAQYIGWQPIKEN